MDIYDFEEYVAYFICALFTILFTATIPPIVVGSAALTKYWWGFL